MRHFPRALMALAILLGVAASLRAEVIFFNGFETNTSGWDVFGGTFDATRVPSGTNGITSASGNWHAESGTAATNWGGYDFGMGPGVPFMEYTTSLAVFLDVGGGWANDTRFDYTSAINYSAGSHLRDFAFNGGFYDDNSGPGAGTNRFIFSASNNTGRANSFPKNPGRDPFAIDQSGWYTFEHHFYDNFGVLAVDLAILDSGGATLNTWTLSSPTDLIAGVGGNRYGWFPNNEFGNLAIDDSQLTKPDAAAVPEPASVALWTLLGIGGVGCGVRRWRKRRSAA